MALTDWNYIENLAEKSLAGDQIGYREFLELLQSYVEKKVRKSIPRDAQDDVIQEILLGIHKSLKTLDLSRSCKSWVNAIAHYKVADYLRSLYSEELISDKRDDIADLSSSDSVENKQYINHLTSILNPNEKQIILKLKYEGHSVADVAKELGQTEANIKVISFRAIKKMREFINDEEFHER